MINKLFRKRQNVKPEIETKKAVKSDKTRITTVKSDKTNKSSLIKANLKKLLKNKAVRTFLILVLLGATGIISLFGINHHVIASTSKDIITMEEAVNIDADCIIVLGAKVHGETPSVMLEDRILEGINLYNNGAADRLLMSGDHGRVEYDEVNVMKDYAVEQGIPSEKIFMDHAGFSTYESIYRARDIFQAKKVIIVTQDYHLYRALYDAEQLGLEAYGVAANPQEYAGQEARDKREKLARVKDFLYCVFKPEPTYLGEAIPISGNGDLTNDKTDSKAILKGRNSNT